MHLDFLMLIKTLILFHDPNMDHKDQQLHFK